MLPLHFLRVLNPLILGSIVDTYRRRPSELRGHVGPITVESHAYRLAVPDDVLRREVFRQQVRGVIGTTDLLCLQIPPRTRSWIQRYWTRTCLSFPRPSRATMPRAALASE